ncbi:hypothetical protein DSM19430T_04250 [Desulfovibrio psychrotolerans]|uniref:ABC transporter substrate-binding protein n=2 Tax=Desulfovibrio psychrotolerans TaxID=415242 RepID=A0A7J0BR99_9BACT|nr:hypothetical protein DSM19430T_04250 [Desulfovibrio psychrotolerans]
MRRTGLAFFLILAFARALCAADLGAVVVVGPEWERFTNRDGTGLYHEILDNIFTRQGVHIARTYAPPQRSNDLVQAGRADMMTCRDRAAEPLFVARYPMYEADFHVFFNRRQQPEWEGPQTLAGKTVVFRMGYYSERNFPESVTMREVRTPDAALSMVLLGRADYYVDDLNFIQESLADARIPFNRDDYAIQVAGRRQYFPVLLDSPRGRAIEQWYARGMERLHNTGELREIYEKWGFAYPCFNFPQ